MILLAAAVAAALLALLLALRPRAPRPTPPAPPRVVVLVVPDGLDADAIAVARALAEVAAGLPDAELRVVRGGEG